MKELVLTPQGAKALGAMVLSCGEIEDCDLMLGRLQGIAEAVPMRSLAERADDLGSTLFEGSTSSLSPTVRRPPKWAPMR
jgi:hypothetical protein